ncbi:MAG: Hsp20/alpha crystallin family protein [Desulfobacula sp.]|nr:Hsp20/alpha crystallin family protein [Desulfobacula sp.]
MAENTIAAKTEVQDLQKKEHKEERTVAGRFFIPQTDIVENKESLIVTMDLPGVKKEDLRIKLENNILEIDGRIDYSPYEKLNPVYTEYNIGNYARSFTVSHAVDTRNIEAVLNDGVLTLTLLKTPEAEPREIRVQ